MVLLYFLIVFVYLSVLMSHPHGAMDWSVIVTFIDHTH